MSVEVRFDDQQAGPGIESMRTTYDKSSDGTSDIPPAHEQCICNATVSGIRNLIDKQRHRSRKASRSTAHEESRQDESRLVTRTAEPDSQCKEAVAHVNAQLAAIPVGYPRHGQVCNSGASPVDRIDET